MSHVVFVDSRPTGFAAVQTAKRLGHRVTFVASDAYAAGYAGTEFEKLSREVDRVVPLPGAGDPAALRDVLREVARSREIDGVVALHDEVVQGLAPVAADLGLRYTSPAGVANARDKTRARDLLAAAGLTSVGYAVVQDPGEIPAACEKIGYPAVVKLAAGSASVATTIVHSPDDLARVEQKIAGAAGYLTPSQRAAFGSSYIVEPYLTGPLMSVEVAATGGEVVPLAVLERQRHARDQTIELGSVAPARLTADEDTRLREYAVAVLRTLGLDLGVFHIEVIHTATGPCLIDPNPRLVGGPNPLLIAACWEIDIYEYLVAAHLGERLAPVAAAPLRHGGAHVLAPAADAVCATGLDLGFLAADERIRDVKFRVVPGRRVPRAESNLQYVGHILATGESRAEVVATCVGAVEELSRRSGVPIVTWDA